jgi:hypothetical protein
VPPQDSRALLAIPHNLESVMHRMHGAHIAFMLRTLRSVCVTVEQRRRDAVATGHHRLVAKRDTMIALVHEWLPAAMHARDAVIRHSCRSEWWKA